MFTQEISSRQKKAWPRGIQECLPDWVKTGFTNISNVEGSLRSIQHSYSFTSCLDVTHNQWGQQKYYITTDWKYYPSSPKGTDRSSATSHMEGKTLRGEEHVFRTAATSAWDGGLLLPQWRNAYMRLQHLKGGSWQPSKTSPTADDWSLSKD